MIKKKTRVQTLLTRLDQVYRWEVKHVDVRL